MASPSYLCALDTLEVEVDTLDTLDSTLDTLKTLFDQTNPDPSGCKQQIQNKTLKEPITSWMNLEYDT